VWFTSSSSPAGGWSRQDIALDSRTVLALYVLHGHSHIKCTACISAMGLEGLLIFSHTPEDKL
jgi:hypothetical protein